MIRAVALVLATLLLPACQSASPSAAAGAAAAAHPLIGTSWLAQDIDERGVLPDLQSTLTVESAERVSGHGGCNRYFGRVELEESNIGISRVGSTKMACPPAVMDQERRFMNALQAASSWERGGDILIIFDGERRQRLRLSAVLPPSSSPRAGGDTRVFNAAGHSPGWTLELLPDRIHFVAALGADRVVAPAPEARAGAGPDETVYLVVTESHRLTVSIRAAPCVDSMSNLRFPAMVGVILNGTQYRGCGQCLR